MKAINGCWPNSYHLSDMKCYKSLKIILYKYNNI